MAQLSWYMTSVTREVGFMVDICRYIGLLHGFCNENLDYFMLFLVAYITSSMGCINHPQMV